MIGRMARFETDSEARRLGEALAALRRACGLSQAEAGRRAGMTGQGWGLYEAGKRPGLFRPDVQRRLAAALGASPAELDGARTPGGDAVDRLEGAPGVRSSSVLWEGPPSAAVRRLRLSDDALAPWASSGVVLEYVPGRWPRRGQGCVVETPDGRRLPRIYERMEGDILVVRGGPEGLAAEERLSHAAAVEVSAVIARLESE